MTVLRYKINCRKASGMLNYVFIYSGSVVREASVGKLLTRTGPGVFAESKVCQNREVYLFNSGINTCIIGPTTKVDSLTSAKGTRSSSTDKKPLPSPPR